MKVYVVRHGATELNKKGIINGHIDDDLTPEGVEQAKELTLLLPNTIKHIYSSSLGRAKQTAEIINEKLKVPITFHDELKEVNFGVLNGTPFLPEYKKRHAAQDYDWRPSGESFEDVKKRVLKILKVIKSESKDGEALIVAHGGTIRLMTLLESGETFENIENASLYTFDLDKVLKNA
jgi:broad specificity phosphatase PhoE